jgi:hypothetical protein
VGGDQFIHYMDNVVKGQFSRGMRVHHGGMLDMFLFMGIGRLNGEELDVDVAHSYSSRQAAGEAGRQHRDSPHWNQPYRELPHGLRREGWRLINKKKFFSHFFSLFFQ